MELGSGKAPVKTDVEWRRKQAYGKGLATRSKRESCGGGRHVPAEAFTGAHAGRVLSSESKASACRPRFSRLKCTRSALRR